MPTHRCVSDLVLAYCVGTLPSLRNRVHHFRSMTYYLALRAWVWLRPPRLRDKICMGVARGRAVIPCRMYAAARACFICNSASNAVMIQRYKCTCMHAPSQWHLLDCPCNEDPSRVCCDQVARTQGMECRKIVVSVSVNYYGVR